MSTTTATELSTDPAPATEPLSLPWQNRPGGKTWAEDLELEEEHEKLDLEAAGAIDSAIKRDRKRTIWHEGFSLPPSATRIFCNPTLRTQLCGYCTDFANGGVGNIVFDNDGKLIQVFCGSCLFKIRSHAGACTGGHEGCVVHRHVSPLGDVAPLCKVCHQAQTQTQRGKRGKRGGASRAKQGNAAAKAPPPKRLGNYVNV
jgi:hypothetical protein